MLRIRFKANGDDPRPIHWPIKHPYWITGEAGDGSYSTVVAYADDEEYIYKNWPEVWDLDIQEVEGYSFSERFPKPDWFNEESAMKIKSDPSIGAPRVQSISDWVLDRCQPNAVGIPGEVSPADVIAKLVELLVEKGILDLHELPRLLDVPYHLSNLPE